MKILLLDNSSLTPVNGDYCIDPKTGIFAKELKDLDNMVTLYGQKVISENTTHTYRLVENGLKVVGLNRKSNKLLNYLLLYIRIIPEIFKNDFVYIFYPSSYKFVALLCWLFQKNFGIYIRGQHDLNSKSSHMIYNKSTAVFTVTNEFTNFVNNVTGKENAFTIRPMIPFTEKDVCSDRSYNINGSFRILFLGRVLSDKGIFELLQALSKLKMKKYNFELTIVGDGGGMQDAKSIVQELGLEEKVSFIGAVDDMDKLTDFYKTSDVYILPTYHEGFPRTLYEAMIFGTPIITTFVGGISGLMKDGYNCKRIEPKSVDSIVVGLEFAFNNYDKMIQYAGNGQKTVIKIIDSSRLTHAEHLNQIIKSVHTKV